MGDSSDVATVRCPDQSEAAIARLTTVASIRRTGAEPQGHGPARDGPGEPANPPLCHYLHRRWHSLPVRFREEDAFAVECGSEEFGSTHGISRDASPGARIGAWSRPLPKSQMVHSPGGVEEQDRLPSRTKPGVKRPAVAVRRLQLLARRRDPIDGSCRPRTWTRVARAAVCQDATIGLASAVPGAAGRAPGSVSRSQRRIAPARARKKSLAVCGGTRERASGSRFPRGRRFSIPGFRVCTTFPVRRCPQIAIDPSAVGRRLSGGAIGGESGPQHGQAVQAPRPEPWLPREGQSSSANSRTSYMLISPLNSPGVDAANHFPSVANAGRQCGGVAPMVLDSIPSSGRPSI